MCELEYIALNVCVTRLMRETWQVCCRSVFVKCLNELKCVCGEVVENAVACFVEMLKIQKHFFAR